MWWHIIRLKSLKWLEPCSLKGHFSASLHNPSFAVKSTFFFKCIKTLLVVSFFNSFYFIALLCGALTLDLTTPGLSD